MTSSSSEARLSNEADVFPTHHPERSELIDSTIGEGSPFQRPFGYYAHGVDETPAVLPEGWRDRLILVPEENTRCAAGVWRYRIWRSPNMRRAGKRFRVREHARAARYDPPRSARFFPRRTRIDRPIVLC
jgi:hypothetical protein